ncbi:hypothetical protein GCM10008107_18320 [Psychrosphaera saromensis]|uniref:Uncharacterized protein n=1 Tax=Psychrosphaera saromensis TaxID=716813 RepID=A0A2S7USR5_9GAMM|nr:hypothetical protein [Psychrosphaera saromensis]PQJ52552.1 hypothetical protein BTO11_02050 [Psychrosphaera saromensis]GHB69375.1 hypothetical protein GCM10008107_18320 [Psychrosphaera saromensis]GLQ13017.1 hypothetical protein GCM10007917_04720 [Psychrosphaera saromensis]
MKVLIKMSLLVALFVSNHAFGSCWLNSKKERAVVEFFELLTGSFTFNQLVAGKVMSSGNAKGERSLRNLVTFQYEVEGVERGLSLFGWIPNGNTLYLQTVNDRQPERPTYLSGVIDTKSCSLYLSNPSNTSSSYRLNFLLKSKNSFEVETLDANESVMYIQVVKKI